MSISPQHRTLSQLAALYCRRKWLSNYVAIEPLGPNGRNYDIFCIKKKSMDLAGLEVKISRSDFLKGIKKGQFKDSLDVTETWLVYTGDFSIKELPLHCGILAVKFEPSCTKHEDICPTDCSENKTIYFKEVRKARSKEKKQDIFRAKCNVWMKYIAMKNSTDMIQHIEYNLYQMNETES